MTVEWANLVIPENLARRLQAKYQDKVDVKNFLGLYQAYCQSIPMYSPSYWRPGWDLENNPIQSMDEVEKYAKEHTNPRTAIVLKDYREKQALANACCRAFSL